MRVVGVIPAAGHATRLQPLSCSKEVLPVGGRPVMDYLVERMRVAPCHELRVVTRPEKEDVVARATALGAEVVEAHPASVAESLLCGLRSLRPDDTVLFGFPDSIWEPLDGFARLLENLDEVTLGLFRCANLRQSDVVTVEGDRVAAIHVKPAEPPSELIWGCLAARVEALAGLAGLAGHAEPGDYLDGLARAGRVRGLDFGTEFVDFGTPESLQAAQ
jgi:glucose-1-phosphate thymidylyltransferase